MGSKIHQVGLQNQEKSTKLGSKIHQVGFQNQEKSVLGGLWRGLGAILAPRPAQDQNIPPKQISGPLLGTHFGGQNHPKINFLGFQEVLIFDSFLDRYKIDFFWILSPTCHPKPSLNRAKLGVTRHPKSKQPISQKTLKAHNNED